MYLFKNKNVMEYYINKSALIAEIERRKEEAESNCGGYKSYDEHRCNACIVDFYEEFLEIIDTIEVKTDEENSLEKFKSLQHISGDLHQTLEDWGYAPNLYFFDGMWKVSWISCEEGDSIKDFEGNTPEEAINKAYDWFHSTFCNS